MMDVELGVNGIVFISWAAKSWLRNPVGGLAEKKKKRFCLMLCICSLEKYMVLTFLETGEERKENMSKYCVWGLSSTKLGLSLFSGCSIQARGLLLRVGGGRRIGEQYSDCGGGIGADRGFLGQCSVAWKGSHTPGTFWITGKNSCPQKLGLFLVVIFWHAFSQKSLHSS